MSLRPLQDLLSQWTVVSEWVYVTHGVEFLMFTSHTHTHTHTHTQDADGMLCQALLVGNFEAAVDICISADRMVSHASVYVDLLHMFKSP